MAANVDLAMNCCRLCLDDLEQKENHLVFDNSLFLRILVVASVEITSADSLPKRICNDCRYQLEKSYYFRMKAKQAQTQLRKHIKLIKAGKKSNLLDKQKFQITDFEDEELEEQYLEACNFFKKIDDENKNTVSQRLKKVEEEMKRKLLEQKTTLVAQFEKEKKQILKDSAKNAQKAALKSVLEKTQKLLQEEINVSDDEDTPPPVAPSSPEPEKIEKRSTRRSNVNIISVEAPKSLNIQPVLLSDPEEVEKEVYTIVDTRFKSENPESDNEDMEPEEMIYYDEVDEENEANGTEYKEQEHLLILNYSNEQQDESKEPTPEDENVNDKGELKIFKCQICSQGFTRAGFLKAHQAKHNKKGGYECSVANCGKLFPTNHSLERHSRTHTGEKPYFCNFAGCQKSFAQKEILKRHQLVHSGLTPFKCMMCTSEFRQKILLKQHMQRKHTDNPDDSSLKFKCLWCPKEFAHQSGLSRHNLTHTGKVFTCSHCRKTFSDNSALKRHEMTHTKKESSAKKSKHELKSSS